MASAWLSTCLPPIKKLAKYMNWPIRKTTPPTTRSQWSPRSSSGWPCRTGPGLQAASAAGRIQLTPAMVRASTMTHMPMVITQKLFFSMDWAAALLARRPRRWGIGADGDDRMTRTSSLQWRPAPWWGCWWVVRRGPGGHRAHRLNGQVLAHKMAAWLGWLRRRCATML